MLTASIAILTMFFTAVAASGPTDLRGGPATCHNITGTCLPHGYVCANDQVVKFSQRCDGVEDCADGTDEFMCEHPIKTPLHEHTAEERHAFEQASCVRCRCAADSLTITSSSAWFKFALVAPTDTIGLMTGVPNQYGGMPCNAKCTTSMQIGFYRKTGVCRGYLCCARQQQCLACTTGTTACPGSISPAFAKRCYSA